MGINRHSLVFFGLCSLCESDSQRFKRTTHIHPFSTLLYTALHTCVEYERNIDLTLAAT